MDIDKLTEQILEITNNSDYGWIDLDSTDADRIRVTLTKALTIPVVSKSFYCLAKIHYPEMVGDEGCDEQCVRCKLKGQ